jgi:hypothetical protein
MNAVQEQFMPENVKEAPRLIPKDILRSWFLTHMTLDNDKTRRGIQIKDKRMEATYVSIYCLLNCS